MMIDAEIVELAADIDKNGLHESIVIWIDNREQANGAEGPFPQFLLDGRNRLEALRRLGVTDPRNARCGSSDMRPVRYFKAIPEVGSAVLSLQLGDTVDHMEKPAAYILSMNVHRRHLTSEQKREAIRAFIKAEPQASDRKIAKELGVDHETVGDVRKESVPNGENRQTEHLPVERAKAAVRANPGASITVIAESANVGRATAQRAQKLVAVGSEKTEEKRGNHITSCNMVTPPQPLIDAEQEMKKKVEQFRASIREMFASWMKYWGREIGLDATKEIIGDEARTWLKNN